MFDFVQKHRRILQIFLGLIALTFATWGIESYTRFRGSADEVASVNGIKISQREFEAERRQQEERMRQLFGGRVDPAALDTPQARQALLEQMIGQRLVASQAASANLGVSDETLIETIQSIPAFQESGKFSKAQYEAMLRAQNPPMTPAQFEARLRYDLALTQLVASVSDTAIVPRAVTERLNALASQKREIADAPLRADQYVSQVKVDDAKAKAYYDANTAQFNAPERVRAEYVMLSAQALQEPATEEEIRKAYDARASQFRVDEQRRASHILVKTKEEAEQILAQLKKSPGSFAELAKKHSQDTGSAEKGGDLGWFARGMMVKPFEDAAFSMKQGELSGPVQSEFGYHIIKLTGVQAGKTRTYDEVKKELAPQIARDKGAKKFAEQAEAFSNMVYEQPDSLKPAAERFKLKVQTTGWISKSAGQELGALDNPKLLAALFSTDAIKNKRNTDAIEVAPSTLVSARVLEYQPARQRTFDEVKGEIVDLLRKREAAELARKDGEAKLEALRKGQDVGVKWSNPRTVSRREPGGLPGEVLQKVVTADVSKLPAYAGVPVPDAGFVLLRISKVIEPDPKQLAEDKSVAQLYGAAQYDALLASLREHASISVRKESLEEKK
ncbi:MAG TPA: SurA N-terminal domain-containing protein [Burkholderiales bacterium]|nr:SurA N-terminal domain-containing protein [Burkholderiales bacterium]